MLNEKEARDIAVKKMPSGSRIVKVVPYKNLYILQILWPDPAEGHLDPFFSVDKKTGKFRDFSIVDGGVALIRQFAN